VANGQERLREAAKHGFKAAIVPFANRPKEPVGSMTVHGVKTLPAALEVLQSL
jgi:DNA repair protein RadA/Sms